MVRGLQFSALLPNHLGVRFLSEQSGAQEILPDEDGVPSLPPLSLAADGDGAHHDSLPDALFPAGVGSSSLLYYRTSSTSLRRYAAVTAVRGEARSVVVGFGLEGVAGAATRREVLDALLNWLLEDPEGGPDSGI